MRAEHNLNLDARRAPTRQCLVLARGGFDLPKCGRRALSPSTIMSFAGYDEGDAWGAPEPVTSGDIVADAMRKEKIIKLVAHELRCTRTYYVTLYREIQAAQQDLKGMSRIYGSNHLKSCSFVSVMLERVKSAEKDVDKLTGGNATLQMYIDNLTRQIAKPR